MIKAFIFDMDGVIIDSEPLHFESDRRTMKEYGIIISDEILNQYVGITNFRMWRELIERFQLKATVETLLDKQMQHKCQLINESPMVPIEGVLELLTVLKHQGIKTGLASSSNRDFIELILDKLQLTSYFEVVVSGEDIVNGKPAPDIFLKAAELLDVSPEQCMVLEDSEHGVNAAKAAGMVCIGYKNPNSGHQDLSSADKLIFNISEIKMHLMEI